MEVNPELFFCADNAKSFEAFYFLESPSMHTKSFNSIFKSLFDLSEKTSLSTPCDCLSKALECLSGNYFVHSSVSPFSKNFFVRNIVVRIQWNPFALEIQ